MSGIPQIMPIDDDIPVNSFNPAHTTLLLGCTDFTQGFQHSNLNFNPSPMMMMMYSMNQIFQHHD